MVYPLLLSELVVRSRVSGREGMKKANRRMMSSTVGVVMHGGEAECFLGGPSSKMRTEGLGVKEGDRKETEGKEGDPTTEAHIMEENKPKRRGRPRKLKAPKLIKQTEDEPIITDNVVDEEDIGNTRAYFVLAFCGTKQQAFAEKCALRVSERLGELIDVRLVNTGEHITKKERPTRGGKWETLVYDPEENEHMHIWIEGARSLSLFSSSTKTELRDVPDEDDIQSYLDVLEEETRVENFDVYPL